MKRILPILLAILLTLTMFASCNTSETTDGDDNANASAIKNFTYKNTEIKINSDSKDIVAKLGEPKDTEVLYAGCGDSTPGYI